MSIKETLEKIKARFYFSNLEMEGPGAREWYTALVVVLVGFSAFGLGRLSILDENRPPVTIEYPDAAAVADAGGGEVSAGAVNQASPAAPAAGAYVAAKTGTKYYLPWCLGASRISEKNKVWFNSKAEAERAGYQPAANCKGL